MPLKICVHMHQFTTLYPLWHDTYDATGVFSVQIIYNFSLKFTEIYSTCSKPIAKIYIDILQKMIYCTRRKRTVT